MSLHRHGHVAVAPAAAALIATLAIAGCGGTSHQRTAATAPAPASTAPTPAPATATATTSTPAPGGATVAGHAGALQASMTVGSATPTANARWPASFTATDAAHHPLQAVVVYQFLFNGSVVSTQSTYRFTGHFTDPAFVWPTRAVGIPLTFRAVVTAGHDTVNLDYPVHVQR